MGNSVTESSRQSMVIMKNEIKKFFSGKRMLVFLVLMGLIVFILALLPPILGKESNSMYFYTLSVYVVLIAATLFASISIVSEYEERTALIIFTRPVRKTSIFIGKALASYVVTVGFMAAYYLIAAIVELGATSSVSMDLLASFGYTCLYAFAATGIAMMVSAFMKKSSTSTIITFVILAVIFMALSIVLNMAKIDTSWILSDAAESISTCSEAYRTYMNEMINGILEALANPSYFIDPNALQAALIAGAYPISALDFMNILNADGVWYMSSLQPYIGQAFVVAPDGVHDALCMIGWGLAGFLIAFIRFCKREF